MKNFISTIFHNRGVHFVNENYLNFHPESSVKTVDDEYKNYIIRILFFFLLFN